MDLIDTDVLIDVQRGHPPALTWFAGLTTLPSVPGIVAMELIQDARNAKEVRQAKKLVAPFQSAVGHSATLFTFNSKHYKIVPGLKTAKPYRR